MTQRVDCLIVGGGPAGLTAAIYAARFRLSVRVIDSGEGRAAQIPCTRNHAGFPGGVSGKELLKRMHAQALEFGARVDRGAVSRLHLEAGGLAAETSLGRVEARAVLLATGVANCCPAMPPDLRGAAVAAGRLRFCPVCDGYEVRDQDVAVIGTSKHGVKEALFLRAYTGRITLVSPDGPHALTASERAALAEARVLVADGPVSKFRLESAGLGFQSTLGWRAFEAVYPAMGSIVHSSLAKGLAAKLAKDGCIKVDTHQRTSVQGLSAAGDVVKGLDQISHAMGQAGVAATTIRNDLAATSPILR